MEIIRIRPEKIYHPEKQRYEKAEIRVLNGIVDSIGNDLQPIKNERVLDLPGMVLSPGWIDIHVHANPRETVIGMNPDEVGIDRGSPIVLDAGTVGTDDLEDYLAHMERNSITDVKILLNISKIGLRRLDEGSDPAWIDEEAIRKAVRRHPDKIVGIKARASASVVGDQGIRPIQRAKAIARELSLPLVVHIGNMPPRIEVVLELMEAGDVVTHCYHNKPNGLFDQGGNLIQAACEAQCRGVLFDVGHGSASFSFETAERAMENGFVADLISTDLYEKNIEGPVISLSHVMDKMIQMGMSVEDAITKVTDTAAKTFHLDGYGCLKKGGKAIFTAFTRETKHVEMVDSVGTRRMGDTGFGTIVSIVDGEKIFLGGVKVPEIIREIEKRLELTPEEQKEVREVLAFSTEQGVMWEDQFRLGFLSHMISLIRRARDGEWVAEMDESLFEEVSPKAIELAEELVKAFTKEGALHRSEVLLVSTHYEMALRKES